MQQINFDNLSKIYGGNGSNKEPPRQEKSAAEQARAICDSQGFPDSAEVTITTKSGGSSGASSTYLSGSNTVEIKTTCGDLRKAGR